MLNIILLNNCFEENFNRAFRADYSHRRKEFSNSLALNKYTDTLNLIVDDDYVEDWIISREENPSMFHDLTTLEVS